MFFCFAQPGVSESRAGRARATQPEVVVRVRVRVRVLVRVRVRDTVSSLGARDIRRVHCLCVIVRECGRSVVDLPGPVTAGDRPGSAAADNAP